MIRTVDAVAYDERLGVPLRWWVQGTMMVASLWLALVVAIPGPAAWACSGIALALLAALLVSYGGARVSVTDGWLLAGQARIEAAYVGEVAALDAEETRRVAGPQADARAYLLLRPYLRRAVRVEITDPADPAPYWLLSTRHPDRLAAAVRGLAESAPA
jgi:predicted membrane metal-binding protein